VRVHTDGQTDRRTDANRFYNLSHVMIPMMLYAITMGQIIKRTYRVQLRNKMLTCVST